MIELIPTSWSELEPYALSAVLAGFYIGIAPLLPKRQTWARALVILIGLAAAVHYLGWRLLETIRPAEWMSIEGFWFIGVYLFELLSFLNYAVLFVVLVRWVDRSTEADRHEADLRRLPAREMPNVDVLIPTYNEGPEVVERTVLAALQMDYPKFQVWVLDDGGRDWLANFCAECGAGYIRRTECSHAKAGNLNHALAVTTGELFAIFDADFAPSRSFLARTVGFFADPRIGIVQTPQHFFNRDPIQVNLGLVDALPDEQRLFFDVIAPSRDAWDSAFCCGSCSIQRRAAIAEVGGVPTESITEDILSTLVLLRRGYITRYLNERLSNGLAAEGLKGYFTQRERWCRGAIQTLFLKSGPLGPGLSPLQRVLFFPLDWLVQYFCRLLVLVVPIVFLWTGVGPFRIKSTEELITHQLPAVIALLSIFRFLAPDCYVPGISTAISLFTSLRIVPTVLASLVRPFGVPFRVTPKGRNNAVSNGDTTVLGVVAVLAALTLGGLILNRISPNRSGGNHPFLIVAEVFALYNLVLLALVAVIAIEVPRPRRVERFPLKRPGSYRQGGRDFPCSIQDISEFGALLYHRSHLNPGKPIELDIAGLGVLPANAVRQVPAGTAVEFCRLSRLQRASLVEFIYSANLPNQVARVDVLYLIMMLFSHMFGVKVTRSRKRG